LQFTKDVHFILIHLLNQRFADWQDPAGAITWNKWDKGDNPAVKALFGYARNDKASKEDADKGRAGRVILDDLYLPPKSDEVLVFMHNSIDRFTGGVRQHMLFGEEVVGQKDVLRLRLIVLDGSRLSPPSSSRANRLNCDPS
jgi:hypothetical protein